MTPPRVAAQPLPQRKRPKPVITSPSSGRKPKAGQAKAPTELVPNGKYVLVHGTVARDAHGKLTDPGAIAHPAASGAQAPQSAQQSLGAAPATATVPGAPTNVTGKPRDGAVTVSWTAPASNGGAAITGYTVTANPSGATATSSGATSAEVFGLANGTAYKFTVTATNSVGTGPASAASAAVTPVAATNPGAPTNVTAKAGNAQITVSWTMPASDGGADLTDSFVNVYNASDGSNVGYVDVTAPTATATIANLTDGTAYYATVYVENRSFLTGNSVQSGNVTPQAGPQPAPPASVTAKPGVASATVSWTAPSSNGGSPVTGYVVTTYNTSNTVVGTPVTVSASTLSTTISSLTNGDPYYFGVAATNSAGTGPALYSASVTPAGPPSAPQNLEALPSDQEAFVEWSKPANDGGASISGYSLSVSSGGTVLATQSVAGTSALVSSLTDGSAYTFTVTASNALATGTPSAPSSPATPSAALPHESNGLNQTPPFVNNTVPTQPYTQQNPDPYSAFSGNGRYIFHKRDDGEVNGVPNPINWYRYDMVTGVDTRMSVAEPPVNNGDVSVAADYAGDRFIFVDIVQLPSGSYAWETYLYDVASATTTLVSTNAGGAPAAAGSDESSISANGQYVFFSDPDSSDMAAHSTCSGVSKQGDWYRYSIASKSLVRIALSVAIPAGTGIQSIGCVYYNPLVADQIGVSADGSHIAVITGLSTTPNYDTTYADLVTATVSSSGAASGTWLNPPIFGSDGTQTNFNTQLTYPWGAQISDDGSTVVGLGEAYDTTEDCDNMYGGPYCLVRYVNAGAPQIIARDHYYLGRGADLHLSGNGRVVVLDLDAADQQTSQKIAIDMSAGTEAVLSQFGGKLGTDFWALNGSVSSVDYSGTNFSWYEADPNLTGVSQARINAGFPWQNIVYTHVDVATAGIPLAELEGCNCGDALTTAGTQPRDSVGDPINTATGAFSEYVDDATVPAPGVGIEFGRSYDSANTTAGPLGVGWASGYAMSLSTASNGVITVTSDDGSKGVFHLAPDGTYIPDPGITSTLATVGSTHVLTTVDRTSYTFNSTGQLTAEADRSGKGLTFAYTGSSLTSVTDAAGRTATLTYNTTTNRLTKVALADGRTVVYAYDSSNRLSSVTGVDGSTTTYAYDSGNRLAKVTDPDGTVRVSNTYDSTTGRVTNQVTNTGSGTGSATASWDATNHIETYTNGLGGVVKDYYSGNVLTKHVDPDGGVTTYAYDERADPIAVTDPDGNTTRMSYDGAGHLLTKTAPTPISTTESWTYDANGNVLTYTDGAGEVTKYTYDSANRIASVTDPAGNATSYTYTASGELATKVAPGSLTTTYTYDTSGNESSVVDPTNAKTTYTYDSAGHRLTMVDALGNATGGTPSQHTTTYTYNTAGQLTKVTDPLGNATAYTYDSSGRQHTVTDALGNVTTDTYDEFGRLVSLKNAAGYVTTQSYDADGNLVKKVDALGNITTYAYDKADRLVSSVDPRGNVSGGTASAYTTSYGYDAAGNQTTVTDPLGDKTTTAYDALNRAVKVTDALGHATTTKYDAAGRLAQTTDPLGHVTKDSYNGAGDLASQTDPLGNATTYTYDGNGRQLSATTPLGEVTKYTYDGDGRQLTVVDPRGNVSGGTPAKYTTTYVYDADGNLTSSTDGLGNKTSYTYDAAGNKLTQTDPLSNVTTYTYNADYKVYTVTDAAGHATTYHHDALGSVVGTVDALGDNTTYTYDADEHRITETTPRGNVTGGTPATYTYTYGFDPAGNQTTVKDPTGAITTTAYDADNRATSVTDPLGDKVGTTYDAAGNIIASVDATNLVSTSRYDAADELTSSIDPANNTTGYTYDADGNKLSMTSPLGEVTSWTYNKDSRQITAVDPRGNVSGGTPSAYTTNYGYDVAGNQTTVKDPLGNTTTTAYDSNNDITSVTDPLGHATTSVYDADGRLSSVTDPSNDSTGYTYDKVSNLATRTDGNGHVTTYNYSNVNQLTSIVDPLKRTTSYGYNADGDLTSGTDARGTTATTTIDPRGLTTAIAYGDSTPAVSYAYNSAGQRTGITDGTGSRTLTYDKSGRPLSVTDPLASGKQFAYTYNSDGLLATRTYPDGEATAYGYNADSRETSQTADGAAVAYGYDAAGNLTTATLPNGDTETRAYDTASRLTSIGTANTASGANVASWQYTYNADSQPTETDSVRNGATQSPQYFTYDTNGRLASWCVSATGTTGCPTGSKTTSYTYDKAGNRLTQVSGSTSTSYSYDAADQLSSATTGSNTTSYTYDADGNQTGDGTQTITYDANNHPIKDVVGSTTLTFVNDDSGNRVLTKNGSALVSTDLWDTNSALPQLATVTDGSGALVGDYHANPAGLPQSTHTAAGTFYDSHDLQGSVTDLTSSTGVDQYQNSYDPFGVETSTALVSPAPVEPYGYAGQLDDSSIQGAQNLRAREYSAATGRFTSTDPIELRISDPYVSAYVYANDAPTYTADPSGRSGSSDVPSGSYLESPQTPQHNFALRMAYDQEAVARGANNVYADLTDAYGTRGHYTVSTSWSDKAEPDLVAFNQTLSSGKQGEFVWDVKPATPYGFSPGSLSQLSEYVKGVAQKEGKPAEAGPDVTPNVRYNPDDQAIYTIFSEPDWDTYAPYDETTPTGAKQGPRIATTGLIYYSRFKPTRNKQASKSLEHAQPTLELYAETCGPGDPNFDEWINQGSGTVQNSAGFHLTWWEVFGTGSAGLGLASGIRLGSSITEPATPTADQAESWLSDVTASGEGDSIAAGTGDTGAALAEGGLGDILETAGGEILADGGADLLILALL